MNPIKVFYHGKRLKDVYPYATPWEVFKFRAGRFMRKVLIVSAVVTSAGWLVYGGIAYEKLTATPTPAQAQIVTVVAPFLAPVLDRIADCESGDGGKKGTATHLDKHGQVLVKPVMSGIYAGTYDIGYYQINSNHESEATKLGFNLMKEDDNKAFALWLYKNRGTEPWYSSRSCWSK